MPITTAWVCAIARNLARNAARRRQELPMVDEPVFSTLDARAELIADEDIARANAALAALPERYREAVVLHYRHDQSMAEGRGGARHLRSLRAATRTSRAHPAARAARAGRGDAARDAAGPRVCRDRDRGVGNGKASTASAASAYAASTSAKTAGASMAVASRRSRRGAGTYAVVRRPMRVAATRRRMVAGAARSAASRGPRSRAVAGSRAPRWCGGSRRSSGRRTALPPRAVALAAPASAADVSAGSGFVDLDFKDAPVAALADMTSHVLATPIWVVEGPSEATATVHLEHVPALAALDQIIGEVPANRIEVAALRIVPGGLDDADALGGALVTFHVANAPLDDILRALEPALGMPIGRFPDAGDADDAPTVTLDVTGVPAGAALAQALAQTGLGYERTTGFVIAPAE